MKMKFGSSSKIKSADTEINTRKKTSFVSQLIGLASSSKSCIQINLPASNNRLGNKEILIVCQGISIKVTWKVLRPATRWIISFCVRARWRRQRRINIEFLIKTHSANCLHYSNLSPETFFFVKILPAYVQRWTPNFNICRLIKSAKFIFITF